MTVLSSGQTRGPALAALASSVAGRVVLPGTRDYEMLRHPAVRHERDVRPAAVVQCAGSDDVAATLQASRRLGLRVAPRSGGHCFAGRSTTSGIVVDVGLMDDVTLDGDMAVVGAGARLGPMYEALGANGRTVPAGCGWTVGVAGLVLGGGIGVLGRAHGLACDRLVAAEVVLADGRVARCHAGRHADLFWALRGAGGGQFGVVTTLWLRTVPAPTTTAFELGWVGNRTAAAAVAAWQMWAPAAADNVDASLKVDAPTDGPGPLRIRLVGAVQGTATDCLRELDAFTAGVRQDPVRTRLYEGGYAAAKRWLASLDEPEPPDRHGDAGAVPVMTSAILERPMTPGTTERLLAGLAGPARPGRVRALAFTPLGGAYNRVPWAATAFAHRNGRFVLEHSTIGSRDGNDLAAARDWARRSREVAASAGTGRVYPNFPDPYLSDPAWAYHGENLARLRWVKRRYDPDRAFRFHQSL